VIVCASFQMSMEAAKGKPLLKICITGSSSGIGLVAAKKLIADGHTVYHACRSLKRAQEAVKLAGGGIPIECNLASFDSVHKCARLIPTLDILCLNAGVAPSATAKKPKLTQDGIEECIGVNHFGHFLLSHLLFSRMKPGSKVIVTASSVHDPDRPGGQSGGKGATLGTMGSTLRPTQTDQPWSMGLCNLMDQRRTKTRSSATFYLRGLQRRNIHILQLFLSTLDSFPPLVYSTLCETKIGQKHTRSCFWYG